MPRSASPDEIAANASSKVGAGQRLGVRKGSSQAICELAPGSPWNAIFESVHAVTDGLLRSDLVQHGQRGCQRSRRAVSRSSGVSTPSGTVSTIADVDAHAGLERPQLLEPLALLQRRRRQRDEALQRRAAIGVEPDVMVERPVARGRGRAGEIERAQPPRRRPASRSTFTTFGLVCSSSRVISARAWRCRRPGRRAAPARRECRRARWSAGRPAR